MSKLNKVCKFTGGVVFENDPCNIGYEVAHIERDRTIKIAIPVLQTSCFDAKMCQEYATIYGSLHICPWVMCLISGSIKWLHEMELEVVDD